MRSMRMTSMGTGTDGNVTQGRGCMGGPWKGRTMFAALDRWFPGRLSNALAYGGSFVGLMSGIVGVFWLIGALTGGN